MKETFIVIGGLVLQIGVGFAPVYLWKMALVSRSVLGRWAGNINNSTKGFTNKAKDKAEGSNYYQRRQFASDARKQERRRANIANYADTVTGEGWRARALRRRAAGGISAQVLGAATGRELNATGQERIRLSGISQLEKQEHEEVQQGALLLEHNRVTSPGQLAAVAGGRIATGIDGRQVSGAGNRALQLAAVQKIIKAQDAGAIEDMFMDAGVDKAMLVGELQKEQNYSTSKGAGAHFVQMQPRMYTRPEINTQAMRSMSALAYDKLASQDAPAWHSAAAGFASGVGDPGSLAQRQALWDRVNNINDDPRAEALLKGASRQAFNDIFNAGRPTV